MRRGAMRWTVVALMIGVLTMWVVPLGAQEASAPEENFTSPAMLCQAVFLNVLVSGVTTSDVVLMTNPSAVSTNVTAVWASQTGTTNATNFVIPARSTAFTVPGDVGFTAAGIYWVRVSAAGGLAILATIQRLQGGLIAGLGSCFFVG